MVVTGGGALYALWRKALMPLLIFSTRQLGEKAHKERFMQLDHAVESVKVLHHNDIARGEQMTRMEALGSRIEDSLAQHGLALERIMARLDEWDKQADRGVR